MAETLLKRIWFSCRHQFSWPRRSEGGEYYQVCLECGIQYRYDWNKMRRTDRLIHEAVTVVSGTTKKPPRKCGSQPFSTARGEHARPSWQPRERRLRCDSPILFRAANGSEWLHGHAENISRSGLLFHADEQFPLGTALELILDMPHEISGSGGAKVICQAKVARVVPAVDGRPPHTAAMIEEYQLLPAGEVSGL
jgi:hypothetical protein